MSQPAEVVASNIPQLHHYVNGEKIAGSSGRFGDIFNPSMGIKAAEVPLASKSEVEAAIAVAEQAFPAWASTSKESSQEKTKTAEPTANLVLRFMEPPLGNPESLVTGIGMGWIPPGHKGRRLSFLERFSFFSDWSRWAFFEDGEPGPPMRCLFS